MPEEVILMDDVLEDNLLKIFVPAYFWQYIFGTIRVRIKNRVVTYTTVWQNVFSLICFVLVNVSSCGFQHFYYNEFYRNGNTLLFVTCLFGTLAENISYTLNLFINRFTHRENNVKIYAMLQKVDRMYKLDKCNYYTDFQFRFFAFLVFLIVVGFFSGFSAHAASFLNNPEYTMFFAFGILTIYMDVVLGASMIYFLAIRIMVLNRVIKNCIKEYKGNTKQKPKVKTFTKMILVLAKPVVQENYLNLTHDQWIECLQEVLKCYKTVTELFSFTMLNLSVTVLIWSFIVIGAIVLGYHSGLYPLSATVTLGMWAFSYYVILTVTAIINDWFIMEVKKTKLLCIRLISCDYFGPYQKTAKEIIRIIHYNTPIFVVYGIFVFDRRLPLVIIGVFASNVLVLIQFLIPE